MICRVGILQGWVAAPGLARRWQEGASRENFTLGTCLRFMMSGLVCPRAAKALQGKTQTASAKATCLILAMSARGNAARKPRFPAITRRRSACDMARAKGEKIWGLSKVAFRPPGV